MEIEKVRQWINKLRSGSYKQCRAKLVDGTEDGLYYCSLGVALVEDYEIVGAINPRFNFSYPTDTYLPTEVRESLGLHLPIPTQEKVPSTVGYLGTVEDYIVYLNDELEWDFLRIADWLEETFIPYMERNYGIDTSS